MIRQAWATDLNIPFSDAPAVNGTRAPETATTPRRRMAVLANRSGTTSRRPRISRYPASACAHAASSSGTSPSSASRRSQPDSSNPGASPATRRTTVCAICRQSVLRRWGSSCAWYFSRATPTSAVSAQTLSAHALRPRGRSDRCDLAPRCAQRGCRLVEGYKVIVVVRIGTRRRRNRRQHSRRPRRPCGWAAPIVNSLV